MGYHLPDGRHQQTLVQMSTIQDKARFIADHCREIEVPIAPQIRLYLADDETPLWRLGEEELEKLGLPSPFWAFAWAGGQAIARYCLDHADLIKGKKVLDFASGSGLVAIAATIAGATSTIATEIDAFAIEAIRLNAKLNRLDLDARLENLLTSDAMARLLKDPPDILVAGDVFYDAEMAKQVLALMSALGERGCEILIGDPDRAYLPKERLELLQTYQVPVTRELEDFEIRSTRVWRFKG